MNSQNKQIYLIGLSVVVFIACFIFFFPEHIFIADEVSYINRTLEIAGQQQWFDALNKQTIPVIIADYPLGTSFLLTPFYWLFGYSGVYIANLLYVLASIYLIFLTLKKITPKRSTLAVYVLMCVPILFFTHVIMSELPSLFIISFGCYFYFKKQQSHLDLFFVGFCVGLSIWFRETNAIILLVPIIDHCRKHTSAIVTIVLGFCLGIIPRLVSAWLIYGNAFHMKDAGYGFSLNHIAENIPLYSISLIFLFPLVLYPLIQVKSSRQKIISLSVLLFILFHLCYGYNGFKASGVKAILLTSRFLIPLLPLFIISMALINKKWMDRLIPVVPWLAVAATVAFHLLFSMNNQHLSKFKSALQSENSAESVFLFDANDAELLELLTPIQAQNPLRIADVNQVDLSNLVNSTSQRYFIITQRRNDTETRSQKEDIIGQIFFDDLYEMVMQVEGGYQELQLLKLKK